MRCPNCKQEMTEDVIYTDESQIQFNLVCEGCDRVYEGELYNTSEDPWEREMDTGIGRVPDVDETMSQMYGTNG